MGVCGVVWLTIYAARDGAGTSAEKENIISDQEGTRVSSVFSAKLFLPPSAHGCPCRASRCVQSQTTKLNSNHTTHTQETFLLEKYDGPYSPVCVCRIVSSIGTCNHHAWVFVPAVSTTACFYNSYVCNTKDRSWSGLYV